MKPVFINEAFTKAVNDYQSYKDQIEGITFNSFLCVVIRLLTCVYSELDIINPLMTENEEALKQNLIKFGYSQIDLEEFFTNLTNFYKIEEENKKKKVKQANPYFVLVQKQIIDMLICKKMNFHLTEKEVRDFYELLYTPNSKNPLRVSYNYLTAKDVDEVKNYFYQQMKENVKIIEPKEKNLLPFRAYEILNYSMNNISSKSSDEIDKINHEIYDYFKIRENAINKEYLLEKAIEEFEREQSKVTTGNGYVDILLVMSIICTVIMVISIVTFIVM